jgi:hypothetical protein
MIITNQRNSQIELRSLPSLELFHGNGDIYIYIAEIEGDLNSHVTDTPTPPLGNPQKKKRKKE